MTDIHAILASMTLEEKVGQLFVARRPQDDAEAMKGIYTTSVNNSTLDESPMAYKSLSDIVDVVAESVDIIEIIKPIYNFKAAD